LIKREVYVDGSSLFFSLTLTPSPRAFFLPIPRPFLDRLSSPQISSSLVSSNKNKSSFLGSFTRSRRSPGRAQGTAPSRFCFCPSSSHFPGHFTFWSFLSPPLRSRWERCVFFYFFLSLLFKPPPHAYLDCMLRDVASFKLSLSGPSRGRAKTALLTGLRCVFLGSPTTVDPRCTL